MLHIRQPVPAPGEPNRGAGAPLLVCVAFRGSCVTTDDDNAIIYLLGPSELDRRAYRLLLEQELHRSVTIESGFEATAVWAAMRVEPDLVLVAADRASPDVHEAVQLISRLQGATRILVVSACMEEAALKDWGRCGIHGYVVKDGGVDELRPAIAAVLAGRQYFSPGVREAVESGRVSADGISALSRRELELLPLLARGRTLREAASEMAVSYKTADSYRTSLMRKLGVRDRVELARYAIRERIIDP